MANCCFVSFAITFENEENKNLFLNHLNEVIEKAKKEDKGVFIGSNTRYLFDADCMNADKNVVYLNGWVKWALERDEMSDVLHHFIKIAKITKLDCNYEELMSNILGTYVYENNILKDCFLTDRQFADIYKKFYPNGEEDDESESLLNKYHNALNKELHNNPAVKYMEY